MNNITDTKRVFINKNRETWQIRPHPTAVVSQPLRKGVSKVYYKPDGSGRDGHIITANGGTQRNYTSASIDYEGQYLREEKYYPYETPMMNLRHQAPNMKQVGLWQTRRSMILAKKLNQIMQINVEKLSPTPQEGLPFYAQKTEDNFYRPGSRCFRDSKEGKDALRDPVAAQVDANRVTLKSIENYRRNGSRVQ